MSTQNFSELIQKLRQEEYTGEDRCTPCTILNVCIALFLSAVLGRSDRKRGILSFAVFTAVIYLRGYLVPGTPTITKRYFPDWVLRYFDKAEVQDFYQAADVEPREGIDPDAVLHEMDLVQECEDVDDVCLDPDFKEEWMARMKKIGESVDKQSSEDYAPTILGTDELEYVEEEEATVIKLSEDNSSNPELEDEENVVGVWESDAAVACDLATSEMMSEVWDGWSELGVFDRVRLLTSMRLFLEECPICGGVVSMDGEKVDSCCMSYDVYAIDCESCYSRIFEAMEI